jgi:very-short-patch-repair endonuclease
VTADFRNGRRGVELLRPVRRLRRDLTDAERKLWSLLRSRRLNAVKFRRQHEFGPYILDFYCAQHRLAIEADGSQHYEPEGLELDAERDHYLATYGVRILRFTNLEILNETEGVADRIVQVLEETPSP